MTISAQSIGAQINPVTQYPATRASKIMSQFNFDPKIVGEIYDAVLAAKAHGRSETDTFEVFAKKFNIGADLKARILKVMAEAK